MSARIFGTIMRVVAMALAALIAVSIVLELPLFVPLIAVMVELVFASVCRRFVKEIMADERSRHIDEKATAISYRIFTIITAFFALVVLMLRNSLPPSLVIAGQTLAYAVCGLMLVHLASTKYFSRKL